MKRIWFSGSAFLMLLPFASTAQIAVTSCVVVNKEACEGFGTQFCAALFFEHGSDVAEGSGRTELLDAIRETYRRHALSTIQLYPAYPEGYELETAALAENRAKNIAGALAARGVPTSSIRWNEPKRVCASSTHRARVQQQRVEVVFD